MTWSCTDCLAGERIDQRWREGKGPAALDRQLADFRSMRARAERVCSASASKLGPPNCYWNDNGCGYKCLDGLSGAP